MDIIQAKTPKQMQMAKELFLEYRDFLEVDLCFQDFDNELASLPGDYAPPSGALLLAMDGEKPAGCVALRKSGGNGCEMKRLFVRSEYRGKGLGRKLVGKIIAEAAYRGYNEMQLDTLQKLQSAMRLYESMGFIHTKPYYNNPLPGVTYWTKKL